MDKIKKSLVKNVLSVVLATALLPACVCLLPAKLLGFSLLSSR